MNLETRKIEYGSADHDIKHIVHLRVNGMMCQRNCGESMKFSDRLDY